MYDEPFFEAIREGCRSSAQVIAPLVHGIIRAHTVVDVGCGEGWWTEAFARLGCETLGIDGPATRPVIRRFLGLDITSPLPDIGVFDLAVSLEVAEHLPAERAPSFIEDLCRLAPVVLFSAAVPRQGGTGHVNEQWPGYWVELFLDHGFTCSGALRWQVWNNELVENWYRQNLLVCARRPELYPELFDTPLAEPWPVVHPILYEARTGGPL